MNDDKKSFHYYNYIKKIINEMESKEEFNIIKPLKNYIYLIINYQFFSSIIFFLFQIKTKKFRKGVSPPTVPTAYFTNCSDIL